jgi:hypothetical protein
MSEPKFYTQVQILHKCIVSSLWVGPTNYYQHTTNGHIKQPHQIFQILGLLKDTWAHECWQQLATNNHVNEVFFGDDDLFKSLQLPHLFMLCKLHTIPREIKRFKV